MQTTRPSERRQTIDRLRFAAFQLADEIAEAGTVSMGEDSAADLGSLHTGAAAAHDVQLLFAACAVLVRRPMLIDGGADVFEP